MDNQREVAKSREIRITNPDEELPFFYANNTQVNLSNWDLQLDFGMVHDATDTELRVKKKVRIIMSLHHAKAVLGLLEKSLAAYEQNMGEIKLGS